MAFTNENPQSLGRIINVNRLYHHFRQKVRPSRTQRIPEARMEFLRTPKMDEGSFDNNSSEYSKHKRFL